MSNTDASTREEIQKLEDKYLKVDLWHFAVVFLVLAALIAALAVWDARVHVLAPFTQSLLSFFKIQF